MTTIPFDCIVQKESSPFKIEIKIDERISELRKKVYDSLHEESAPKIEDIILWKKNSKIMRRLKTLTIEKLKILGCECIELSDITETIKNIFKLPLKQNHTYIIVFITKLTWMKINDISIYIKTWKAETDDPKAYITFLHGFADRIDFYDHIFTEFSEAGIEVNAFDRRGHGRTYKEVGNPIIGGNWKDAIKDITKFIEKQN
ncbi:1445_t:CDS:2 [Cetraspora pellucida]|uniref:1445_t:CDS:1 n=1 Tax=Cetraspora pellucida TaxID=1433469 RepID=A0A9N9NL10_9GLOM|nr:1445_t:CDS:2 [Cetraspora pellucida]